MLLFRRFYKSAPSLQKYTLSQILDAWKWAQMQAHSPESFHNLSAESSEPLYDKEIEPLVAASVSAESTVLKGANIFNFPRAHECR